MANTQITSEQRAALQGVRIVDLTQFEAGTSCTLMLAWLGADVIKVEPPSGDGTRWALPTQNGMGTNFMAMNVNKKDITLDLKSEEGRGHALTLASGADILVQNFRAGVMGRLKLGYEDLRAANPRLIYCSISGFGQTGPLAHKAGYDSTFQAMSGMMSYSGRPDGTPGEGPIRTGPSLCDVNAGMYAVVAVLAALHHRASSGRGQFIDLGMLDTTLAMVSHHAMSRLVADFDAPRSGNGSPFGAPTDCFPCRDKLVMINGAENRNFAKLCKALGFPELVEDPRFAVREDRVRNQAILYDLIAARTRQRDSRELLAELEQAGLPVAPINDTLGAYEDPQVQHRRMLREVPHPLAGTMKMVANPINYSETPLERYDAPPLLGQHTDEVLGGLLGISGEEIARLRAAGAI
jgi:crotonobetainyl-CoA:carnitine CoA-transferase CaiB-like acyl-CoA transferase